MKIGKLDIKKWEFGKRKLAHPAKIVRRMMFLPFYYLSRVLLFLSILGALGINEAKSIWSATE